MIAYAVPGWIACECGQVMRSQFHAIPGDLHIKVMCESSLCKNNGVWYRHSLPVAALEPVEGDA